MELILLQHLGEMEEDMVAAPVVLEVINDHLFVLIKLFCLNSDTKVAVSSKNIQMNMLLDIDWLRFYYVYILR